MNDTEEEGTVSASSEFKQSPGPFGLGLGKGYPFPKLSHAHDSRPCCACSGEFLATFETDVFRALRRYVPVPLMVFTMSAIAPKAIYPSQFAWKHFHATHDSTANRTF